MKQRQREAARGVGPRRILRQREAAQYIGLAESTLEKMRVTGKNGRAGKAGQPFVRLGASAVGYDLRDLDDWIDRQKRSSTSESRPAR